MADREAKRRFLALKVDEVSLVDSPANEQEFIVLKRLEPEENTMGEAAKNETVTTVATATPEAATAAEGKETKQQQEVVAVEVSKADTNAQVLAKLEQFTEVIAKLATGKTEDAEVEKAKKAKADKEKEETMRKKLGDAGLKGVALQKALDAYLDEEGVTKSAEAPAEVDTEDAATTKTLEALVDVIQKAKSFTPKREEKMKTLLADLKKLMDDMSNTPATQAPSNNLPSGLSAGSGLSDVKKSLDELIATMKNQSESQVATTKALTERLETIEKARMPSQATPTEVTATKTEDVKKGLWAGVL